MDSLVFDNPVAGGLVGVAFAGWGLYETSRALRTTGMGDDSDRSHLPIFGVMFVSIGLGVVLALTTHASLPGGRVWPVVVGLVLFVAGGLFRYWAMRTLGEFFVFNVHIQDGQSVVDTGPYTWIRHPSYLGMLVIVLGLGLTLDNWWALLALLVPTAIALLWRVTQEEPVLREQLGEPYRAYAARTHRLIPGLW